MSDYAFVADLIYTGLIFLVVVGLISGGRAFLRWCDERVERDVQAALGEQAADWDEPTRTQIEDAAADREWADILGVLNLTEAEVRRGYQAARIAHRMDRIRTDIACNQFRRELEDFDGGAA